MLYDILRHAHSGLRYVVILLLLIVVITSFLKWRAKDQNWSNQLATLFKANMAMMHFQVLLGVILFFLSPKVQFNEFTMSNSMTRFFTVEHSIMMLIVVVLVTIAWVKTKYADDVVNRNKTQFVYNAISLLIILAMIPWPFRNLGGSWF